jgi:hypothetical protein
MKHDFFLPIFLILISYLALACDNSPIDPKLLEALQENGSANLLYAKFLSEVNAKTEFNEYFRVYSSIAKTKHELIERLKNISPSSRYWFLHQSLVVSAQSDEKLMALEEESLKQVLEGLEVMQKMSTALRSGIPDPALSPTENEQRKQAALQWAQDINREYRGRLTRTNADLDNARNTSKHAVDLLNKEIEQLGLPNKQENPFGKETAKPSPPQ